MIVAHNPNLPPKFSVLAVSSQSSIFDGITENKLVLASVIGSNRGLTQDEIKKFLEICFCESSFNEKAESFGSWEAGMGMCQIIPFTWNYILKLNKEDQSFNIPDYCLKEFINYDKTHPIFNRECNLLMAAFLFKKEGNSHWNSSKSCWNKN